MTAADNKTFEFVEFQATDHGVFDV